MELAPEHLDPGVVLNSWCQFYFAYDALPDRRVVVRFEFPEQPVKGNRLWIVFNGEDYEVCRTDPGFEEDLIVTAESRAIAEWHLGNTKWSRAVLDGAIKVAGSPSLARALPTWNKQSGWARIDTSRPQGAKHEIPAVAGASVARPGRLAPVARDRPHPSDP